MTSGARERVIDAVRALSLPPECGVLLAVSGGRDSTALARAFHAVAQQEPNGPRLRLAHVNHGLRGAESREDERFVAHLARDLGLELDVVHVDTPAYAATRHLSTETGAREARYLELRRLLLAWGGSVIATGHQQEDQTETFLMHAVRGAGLDGLSGMHVRTADIVRPFLGLSQNTLAAALHEMGQPYRVDRSNRNIEFRRNRVRHGVVPILQDLNPRVVEAIGRTMSLLSDDNDYLNLESARALSAMDFRVESPGASASRGTFQSLHPALQGRILRLMVAAVVGDVHDLSETHVAAMRAAIESGNPTRELVNQLPRGAELRAAATRFYIMPAIRAPAERFEPRYLRIPGTLELPAGVLEASVSLSVEAVDLAYQVAASGPNHVLCDADRLGDQVLVRSRRPGDRISLVGMTGRRKLQDAFVDGRIPPRDRDRIPVLVNADCIAWVPGVGLDRRVALNDDTTRVAHVSFRSFL